MLNKELPFRYPPALYAQKVQGNVTLRLYIDSDGQVRPDSTRIEESSGYRGARFGGSEGLAGAAFVPAKLRGEPMPVSILFPVYFRHPEAPPLPGDTILNASHAPAERMSRPARRHAAHRRRRRAIARRTTTCSRRSAGRR